MLYMMALSELELESQSPSSAAISGVIKKACLFLPSFLPIFLIVLPQGASIYDVRTEGEVKKYPKFEGRHYIYILLTTKGGAKIPQLQGWAKEWDLGCVNSPPAARGCQEAGYTQPRAHSFAQPCTFWI